MDLIELKNVIEKNFDVNLSSNSRNRHNIYAKKVFCKLAYDCVSKASFEKIGRILGLTHATILNHYNSFNVVYDKYKIVYNEIIMSYGFKSDTLPIKQRELNDDNDVLLIAISDDLRQLDSQDLIEFREYRVKPFLKSKLNGTR